MRRPLLEKDADTFIRINEAVPILRKVQKLHEPAFSSVVSKSKPFGLRSDFFNDPAKYGYPPVSEKPVKGGIAIVGTYKYKTEYRYVGKDYPVLHSKEIVKQFKVLFLWFLTTVLIGEKKGCDLFLEPLI